MHQLFRALVQRWLHITGSPSLQLKSPGTCHMGSTQESWWVPSPSQVPPPPSSRAAIGRGGPLVAMTAPRASSGSAPRLPTPPLPAPGHAPYLPGPRLVEVPLPVAMTAPERGQWLRPTLPHPSARARGGRRDGPRLHGDGGRGCASSVYLPTRDALVAARTETGARPCRTWARRSWRRRERTILG